MVKYCIVYDHKAESVHQAKGSTRIIIKKKEVPDIKYSGVFFFYFEFNKGFLNHSH